MMEIKGNQIPSFNEWFEAKYFRSFDEMYCHPYMSQVGALIHHIQHSREYMQEMLQAIIDRAQP